MAKDFERLPLQNLRENVVESKGSIRLVPFPAPWSTLSKGSAGSNSDLRAAMSALAPYNRPCAYLRHVELEMSRHLQALDCSNRSFTFATRDVVKPGKKSRGKPNPNGPAKPRRCGGCGQGWSSTKFNFKFNKDFIEGDNLKLGMLCNLVIEITR
ncbi:hypothetical protein LQW54_012231 [Pestalotiopsis sp. IQ-011]